MPRNIELKLRHPNLDQARQTVRHLGAKPDRVMTQLDTYFKVPQGRLKLREITAHADSAESQSAELIAYHRPDSTEFRDSIYFVTPIQNPATLKQSLTLTLGLRGQVHKHREVWLYHNVRIHLDQVATLGSFIEFEAVMSDTEPDDAPSLARLQILHTALQIPPTSHETASYSDLLGL